MTTVSPGEISLAVDHMMEGRKIDCYGKANVSRWIDCYTNLAAYKACPKPELALPHLLSDPLFLSNGSSLLHRHCRLFS